MASVIQGKVVAVYNQERRDACQHLEQDAPASTTPWPQVASLQATVTTAVRRPSVRWCNRSNVSSAVELHCVQTVPGVSDLPACVCVCV